MKDFVMLKLTETGIKDHEGWTPLKVAMGSSYKIAGSCDAQVVAMLMHRIRHLEEFIMKLPIEGFVDEKCYVRLED